MERGVVVVVEEVGIDVGLYFVSTVAELCSEFS